MQLEIEAIETFCLSFMCSLCACVCVWTVEWNGILFYFEHFIFIKWNEH